MAKKSNKTAHVLNLLVNSHKEDDIKSNFQESTNEKTAKNSSNNLNESTLEKFSSDNFPNQNVMQMPSDDDKISSSNNLNESNVNISTSKNNFSKFMSSVIKADLEKELSKELQNIENRNAKNTKKGLNEYKNNNASSSIDIIHSSSKLNEYRMLDSELVNSIEKDCDKPDNNISTDAELEKACSELKSLIDKNIPNDTFNKSLISGKKNIKNDRINDILNIKSRELTNAEEKISSKLNSNSSVDLFNRLSADAQGLSKVTGEVLQLATVISDAKVENFIFEDFDHNL